jgi:hypothetical protein
MEFFGCASLWAQLLNISNHYAYFSQWNEPSLYFKSRFIISKQTKSFLVTLMLQTNCQSTRETRKQ